MNLFDQTKNNQPNILHSVVKPGQYLNSELNCTAREWQHARAHLLLAFPDTYEIGMSYYGFTLLHELVNAQTEFLADRIYAPWLDMEKQLRRRNERLRSWETRRTLSEFELIGFTLPSELNFTNVLTILDLGGMKLKSAERSEPFPLIIAGGECASAPEPMADFFDAFVIGDGEELLLELLALLARAQAEAVESKESLLREVARLPGVYVPRSYQFGYAADQKISSVRPAPGFPAEIRKRSYGLQGGFAPTHPLVPLIRVVQERMVVEARRGCNQGCRFCRAAFINRPVRERTVEEILKIAVEGVRTTGYDEVSLLSLNLTDYSQLEELTTRLNRLLTPQLVSLAFPSTRISSFDVELTTRVQGVRKMGVTLAPEAGTERLRCIINKPLSDKAILEVAGQVFQLGWHTLKLYFMIGLPGETEEDLEGIITLVRQIERLATRTHRRRAQLNLTLSPFVPKPHTPFQWEGQESLQVLQQKYELLRSAWRRSRTIKVSYRNVEESWLEGLLSRGDRRLCAVILNAWQRGARFDAWAEGFQRRHWLEALGQYGVDPAWYSEREREPEEILPWDHLDMGVSRRYLWTECEKARRAEKTPDCLQDGCQGCGVCDETLENLLSSAAVKKEEEATAASESAELYGPPAEGICYQLSFTKGYPLIFISHLDLVKTLYCLLRRAELPLAYTRGFNPRPRVKFPPPLPLGLAGDKEPLEIRLTSPVPCQELLSRLNSQRVQGLQFLEAQQLAANSPSFSAVLRLAEYELQLRNEPSLVSPIADELKRWSEITSLVNADKERLTLQLRIPLNSRCPQNPLKIIAAAVGKDKLNENLISARRLCFMP